MSEQNKAIVSRYYEEVWNLGQLEAIDELISERFVGHRSSGADYTGRLSVSDSVNALCPYEYPYPGYNDHFPAHYLSRLEYRIWYGPA